MQVNGLYNSDRSPQFGYQLLYTKNSIQGSLINATLSYTQIDNGSSLGLENEQAFFIRLDRPLVSPYTRMAGGLEISQNKSTNVFNTEESEFRKYSYNIQDIWAGYNIGIKNLMQNRNRHFVSFRVFRQRFTQQPTQEIEINNPLYDDKLLFLGAITFFNQNFYKTRYVYGFGRTEDVPYGKQLSIIVGNTKQLNLTRPYAAVDFDKTAVRKNGDFHEYKLQAGGFWRNGDFEDVTLLAYASLFSKLITYKKLLLRQYLGLSYTAIINQNLNTPLTINSEFGLPGFRADSVLGTQRLSAYTQTVVFTPMSLLGFRFAPLVFAELSMVAPAEENLFNQKPYLGLGSGIRTRNENLIFGTIELKVFYFPRVTEDLSNWRISVTSNLRVKYSASFVKAPAFINYN